jgi:UDP-N-acetyl-D-glucosamine dehydrogenase
MRAVEVGHRVVGYDTARTRIRRLAQADSYVEDVPSEQLERALATGRYLPTDRPDNCADFDVAVITVPTPLREGVPDLSYVEDATRVLGAHLRRGCCVVLESTTYPGTTQELVGPILGVESGLTPGVDFHLGYSPERIDPGNRAWGLVNTPKVVSGVNQHSLKAVRAFYDTLVETTVAVSGTGEAELTKLIENTFRHVNVALVNEIAMFAGGLGLDVWESIDATSSKPFGYMRFEPGPGVGGHCLPIDPSYLSWRVQRRVGHPFRFVELANDVNDHMPDFVVNRLLLAMNARGRPLKGMRVLLLGLAYKPNTGDARESPSVAVAERLVSLGAEVRAVDPFVDVEHPLSGVLRVELDRVEVEAADAVVLLTPHSAFDYDTVLSAARFILDTRGRLRGTNVETLFGGPSLQPPSTLVAEDDNTEGATIVQIADRRGGAATTPLSG